MMAAEKILFVNACVRPNSRTCELAKHLLSYMPGEVCQLKLADEKIQPLDLCALEERTKNLQEGRLEHPDFRYARQFAEADSIVIAAPYWDLLFPAMLRNYFEATTVTGITFEYTPMGVPAGLCRAKRLYYVTTAGGPVDENNFGFSYVKALAKTFYGIEDVRCFSAEGLDIYGADVAQIMEDAKAAVSREMQDAH